MPPPPPSSARTALLSLPAMGGVSSEWSSRLP
jgi:hypothetical protein